MTNPAQANATPPQLRVLQGERWPDPKANPYIPLLYGSLGTAEIDVLPFTWASALFGRYDVVHLHWPEFLASKSTLVKSVAARTLLTLLLVRLSVQRIPLVSTMHNSLPHEASTEVTRFFLRRVKKLVRHEIHLTPRTAKGTAARATVIPHGDYRGWFSSYKKPTAISGRIVMFGQLRPYKEVEQLIAAFAEVNNPSFSLRIVGSGRPEYVEALQKRARNDARIEIISEHASDERLCQEISLAELIVLPYEIENSGAILLALSLDRPVLTLRTPTVLDLQEEVGPGWIITAEEAVTAAAIEESSNLDLPSRGAPNFESRSWAQIGAMHRSVYESLSAVPVAQRTLK